MIVSMWLGSEGAVDGAKAPNRIMTQDECANFQDADDGCSTLLNCLNKCNDMHPAAILKVLSQSSACPHTKPNALKGPDKAQI